MSSNLLVRFLRYGPLSFSSPAKKRRQRAAALKRRLWAKTRRAHFAEQEEEELQQQEIHAKQEHPSKQERPFKRIKVNGSHEVVKMMSVSDGSGTDGKDEFSQTDISGEILDVPGVQALVEPLTNALSQAVTKQDLEDMWRQSETRHERELSRREEALRKLHQQEVSEYEQKINALRDRIDRLGALVQFPMVTFDRGRLAGRTGQLGQWQPKHHQFQCILDGSLKVRLVKPDVVRLTQSESCQGGQQELEVIDEPDGMNSDDGEDVENYEAEST